jgi:hypothetical protein
MQREGLSPWSDCQCLFGHDMANALLTSHERFRTINRPACEMVEPIFSNLFLSTAEMIAPLYVCPCSLEMDC